MLLDSVGAAVHFEEDVRVGLVRLRRNVLAGARPGLVTELLNRILHTNAHVRVLLLRLLEGDVEEIVTSVYRAARLKDATATGWVCTCGFSHPLMGLWVSRLVPLVLRTPTAVRTHPVALPWEERRCRTMWREGWGQGPWR